jgi:hypothetical protein
VRESNHQDAGYGMKCRYVTGAAAVTVEAVTMDEGAVVSQIIVAI